MTELMREHYETNSMTDVLNSDDLEGARQKYRFQAKEAVTW
jgi:hypothetical protein